MKLSPWLISQMMQELWMNPFVLLQPKYPPSLGSKWKRPFERQLGSSMQQQVYENQLTIILQIRVMITTYLFPASRKSYALKVKAELIFIHDFWEVNFGTCEIFEL